MDKIEELKQLKNLLDSGAISEAEFELLKKKVLDATIEQPTTTSVKPDNVGYESSNQIVLPLNNNNVNYAALILVAITAITVFLPWVEASSSASYDGNNFNWSSGGISGINLGYGIFGLLMAMIGGILVFAKTKWAAVFGIINILNGIGYAFGWYNAHGEYSYKGGHFRGGIEPEYGLFLFIIASILFTFFSLTFNNKEKSTKICKKDILSIISLIILIIYESFFLIYHAHDSIFKFFYFILFTFWLLTPVAFAASIIQEKIRLKAIKLSGILLIFLLFNNLNDIIYFFSKEKTFFLFYFISILFLIFYLIYNYKNKIINNLSFLYKIKQQQSTINSVYINKTIKRCDIIVIISLLIWLVKEIIFFFHFINGYINDFINGFAYDYINVYPYYYIYGIILKLSFYLFLLWSLTPIGYAFSIKQRSIRIPAIAFGAMLSLWLLLLLFNIRVEEIMYSF